jgi:3-methylcrotonyl-CoA carboxylase beta subunit
MAEESIIVRGQGTIFLGGPPLVKAATGEEVSAEELGGAEVHARTSGVTDHMADDDGQALAIARRIVGNLNRVKVHDLELSEPEEPRYDPAEILGLVPPDPRQPYDVRQVIARLVDASQFDERSTAPPWSAASHGSWAIRWASWPTTGSCSPNRHSRAPTSSSSAASGASR